MNWAELGRGERLGRRPRKDVNDAAVSLAVAEHGSSVKPL